jgi:hypothetical protein
MFKFKRPVISNERGRRLLQFLFCLFLAFIIWSLHKLSDNYSYFFQYKIVAKNSLKGRYPEPLSQNTLSFRGRASGFYILQHKFNRNTPLLTISPENRLFRKTGNQNDQFYILTQEIKDYIIEATGDKLQLEYIGSDTLFFLMPEVSGREIPVAFRGRVTYREQYAKSGNIKLNPSTVTIYGESTLINSIDTLYIRGVIAERIDAPLSGVAELEKIKGVRYSTNEIYYSLDVERYVEKIFSLPIKITNLPQNRKMIIIPERVTLVVRVPLKESRRFSAESIVPVIDYSRIKESRDTIIAPLINSPDGEILYYRVEPRFVSCKVFEKP